MTRILQLSDLHIVEEGALAYGVVDTAAHLRDAIAYIRHILPQIGPVDGVVITGDLTDHGRPEQYQHLSRLLEPLNLPLCVVPGNHDGRAPMREAFSREPWGPCRDALNRHVRFGGVHLIAIDSSVPDEPHGYIADETLTWFAQTLTDLGDEPVIIALHHPPFITGIGHMDAQPLTEPDRLFETLKRHNGPRIIICGHIHRYMTCHHEAGAIMIAPSVAHAVELNMSPGASPQFVMEPGAVLLHSFDKNTSTFASQLIPIGPFEGPYPFGL